ncbi:MAG: PLP-dependent aminotransferase family protein [bacterium]|nr:PLP-dependent aminotransferase family protein [bacterium]
MADFQFSSMASRLRRSEIRELLKLTRNPETISFAGGLPDPAIFPYEAVEAASLRAIRESGRHALQYSPTEGDPFLKEQLIKFTKRQGEDVSAENMLIVASSQQAIDLLSKIFIDPGDPIIVERPTYVGTLQAFKAFDADFHGVELDSNGVDLKQLEQTVIRLIDSGRKPKFVYIIPDFQNPSGITLSLERRRDLLAIASKYDLTVIEDSPYRELRFEGDLLPSLYSLDREGRVIQMKTFSKIFCPGFRLGWINAPAEVIDKLVMAKQGTDLCTAAYSSTIAAYLIQDGYLEKQIEISKTLYRRKAAVMLESLEKFMPKLDGLWWSKPDGGMFMWVHLPEGMEANNMIQDAINLKVAFVIGSCFFHDGSGRNTMRLNYSYPTEEQIIEGVRRLAQVIGRQMPVKAVV